MINKNGNCRSHALDLKLNIPIPHESEAFGCKISVHQARKQVDTRAKYFLFYRFFSLLWKACVFIVNSKNKTNQEDTINCFFYETLVSYLASIQ